MKEEIVNQVYTQIVYFSLVLKQCNNMSDKSVHLNSCKVFFYSCFMDNIINSCIMDTSITYVTLFVFEMIDRYIVLFS